MWGMTHSRYTIGDSDQHLTEAEFVDAWNGGEGGTVRVLRLADDGSVLSDHIADEIEVHGIYAMGS